jgi:flagellar protein FlaG
VLKPQPKSDAQAGKQVPDSGNSVPVKEKVSPDMAELAKALNVASQSIGRDLRFEVDMESGRSVIQVLDRDTGEVIRQIPPEKADLYLSGSGAVQLRLYNNKV